MLSIIFYSITIYNVHDNLDICYLQFNYEHLNMQFTGILDILFLQSTASFVCTNCKLWLYCFSQAVAWREPKAENLRSSSEFSF